MKKKILIFIVFISAFLCFGMSAKAETSCTYDLLGDKVKTVDSSDYKLYDYLLMRVESKYNPLQKLRTYTHGDGILTITMREAYGKPEISYTVKNNNGTVGKNVEIENININSCPDVILFSYNALGENTIATATYFDGNYSNFYDKINLPETFGETGAIYLLGISKNTNFSSYYTENKCILNGYSYQTSSDMKAFQEAMNELKKNYGFNYEYFESVMKEYSDYDKSGQIKKDDWDSEWQIKYNEAIKSLSDPKFANALSKYKDILMTNINKNSINMCFDPINQEKDDGAITSLRNRDIYDNMRYWITLRDFFDGLEQSDLHFTGAADNTVKDNTSDWVDCKYSCQSTADDLQEDCYNSCDEDYPIAACITSNQEKYSEYTSCIEKCKNDKDCQIQCVNDEQMQCVINCNVLGTRDMNTIESAIYDDIYKNHGDECLNLGSTEEKECQIAICETVYKNNNEFLSSKKEDYIDIQNGDTDAQKQFQDDIIGSMKYMIEHNGIDINGDICSIIKEGVLKEYIDIAIGVIRIGGPILVILLTAYDAIMLIASSKEDENKQFYKRLKIRLILVAVLILIPTLINWLLNMTIFQDVITPCIFDIK